jgi:hypothetical protein
LPKPINLRKLISRERKVALDIADLELSIKDVEALDKLLEIGRNREAQHKLIQICKEVKIEPLRRPVSKNS